MPARLTRRQSLQSLTAALAGAAIPSLVSPCRADAAKGDPKWEQAIEKGLRWVAKSQSSLGHWTAGGYPTAMTALAGTALVSSGSATVQSPDAQKTRQDGDSLLGKAGLHVRLGDRAAAQRVAD